MRDLETARQLQNERPWPRAKKMNFEILRRGPTISRAELSVASRVAGHVRKTVGIVGQVDQVGSLECGAWEVRIFAGDRV
jgi:hypothetical protein